MNEPGKYSVIYADPPWHYRVWSKKGAGRSAESHYSTMSLEDIKALPVHLLAAKDCALFLWVTFPLLKEAWPVLDAWGFSYKSVAFVWVKQNRNAPTLFTAWVTGRGQTPRSVCLPPEGTRNVPMPGYIR